MVAIGHGIVAEPAAKGLAIPLELATIGTQGGGEIEYVALFFLSEHGARVTLAEFPIVPLQAVDGLLLLVDPADQEAQQGDMAAALAAQGLLRRIPGNEGVDQLSDERRLHLPPMWRQGVFEQGADVLVGHGSPASIRLLG
ncbi:MAG: hypothetical protein COZ79_08895 [Hydrogenophilales bacterium CG_4_8_14_3_um_filter_62_83]|nr:MAG: hypothetical protein COZ79_08895 [Hydrogenophilales bacterium CG_4_8_14_3_um_filter_62_83]